MSQQAAAVGQISPDGQFVWNGTEWRPITAWRWEPTDWTKPMQMATGVYWLLAGLWTAVVPFVFASFLKDQILKQMSTQGSGLSDEAKANAIQFGLTIGIAFAVFFGLLYIVLGALSFLRRWSWLFYVNLVILGLNAIGVVTSLTSPGPGVLKVSGFAFSLISLGLFVWLLMARIQRGVWAARKVPVVA